MCICVYFDRDHLLWRCLLLASVSLCVGSHLRFLPCSGDVRISWPRLLDSPLVKWWGIIPGKSSSGGLGLLCDIETAEETPCGTCAGLSACLNTPPPAEFPAAPCQEVGKLWCGEQQSWDAAGRSSSAPVVLRGAARAGSWLSSTGQWCWVLTASPGDYGSQRWVKWRKSGGLNSSSSCTIKVSLVLLPTCPSCSLQSWVNPCPLAGTSALPRRCSWLPP